MMQPPKPMDIVPTFEIFRVSSERDPELVESVSGLLSALHRMEKIAADKPGRYFLFECPSRLTLMKIDSRRSLARAYDDVLAKYALPVADDAQDGSQNQIESKPAIEAQVMRSEP